MLDQYVRPVIDPPLNYFGKKLFELGISADIMTIIGFVFGIFAMICIVFHQYELAAVLIFLNRLSDGLDGAIARSSQLTDFGGFLDIVCDFIIYSGVIFVFGLSDSEKLFYACFLIFSFIGPITSFLAYAIIASKRRVITDKRGKKSFYYLGGICEGTETAFLLILCCLLPEYFSIICIVYGVMCWITTLGRIWNAWTDFGIRKTVGGA